MCANLKTRKANILHSTDMLGRDEHSCLCLWGQRAVWSAHLGFIPAPWLIQANSRLSFSLHICKMGLISKPIPFLRGVDVRMKGENLIEYLVQCMATERHQKC